MEFFRDKLKKRIRWILLFSICFGLAILTALVIKWKIGINSKKGLPVEVLISSLIAVSVTAVFRIRNYQKALKTEESLRKLHINETDERHRMIVFKTSQTCFNSLIIMLGAAGIIIPFFSWIIFYTVASILIVTLIIYFIVFYYYSKKF